MDTLESPGLTILLETLERQRTTMDLESSISPPTLRTEQVVDPAISLALSLAKEACKTDRMAANLVGGILSLSLAPSIKALVNDWSSKGLWRVDWLTASDVESLKSLRAVCAPMGCCEEGLPLSCAGAGNVFSLSFLSKRSSLEAASDASDDVGRACLLAKFKEEEGEEVVEKEDEAEAEEDNEDDFLGKKEAEEPLGLSRGLDPAAAQMRA